MMNLEPGQYRLRLEQSRVPAIDLPLKGAGRIPIEIYPGRFFPDTSDEATAQVIRLDPGARMQADFTVSAMQAFRVSGTINSTTGYMLGLKDPSSPGKYIPVTGFWGGPRWHLDAVPAGAWQVTAQGFGNPLYYAEQTIDVRTADVPNVNLNLQPMPAIPVRITGLDPSEPQASLQIALLAQNGNTSYSGSVNGQPALESVLPGSYTVSVQNAPPGSCVDTVTSGSNDLSRSNLVVSPGAAPTPIDVALRTDCAELTVTLNAAGSDSWVVLVSQNRLFQPRIARAAQSVELPGLPPGEYVAYAFSSIENLEYANPEAMRNYSGQSITLASSQRADVKVDVIQRSDH
jgi:hypothetical protein